LPLKARQSELKRIKHLPLHSPSQIEWVNQNTNCSAEGEIVDIYSEWIH